MLLVFVRQVYLWEESYCDWWAHSVIRWTCGSSRALVHSVCSAGRVDTHWSVPIHQEIASTPFLSVDWEPSLSSAVEQSLYCFLNVCGSRWTGGCVWRHCVALVFVGLLLDRCVFFIARLSFWMAVCFFTSWAVWAELLAYPSLFITCSWRLYWCL